MSDLERWIKDNFSGHAVAVRREDDPPIPGEPFMSMDIAKELLRKSITEAVAAERERCAKIVDDFATKTSYSNSNFWVASIAHAIREGEKS